MKNGTKSLKKNSDALEIQKRINLSINYSLTYEINMNLRFVIMDALSKKISSDVWGKILLKNVLNDFGHFELRQYDFAAKSS